MDNFTKQDGFRLPTDDDIIQMQDSQNNIVNDRQDNIESPNDEDENDAAIQ